MGRLPPILRRGVGKTDFPEPSSTIRWSGRWRAYPSSPRHDRVGLFATTGRVTAERFDVWQLASI